MRSEEMQMKAKEDHHWAENQNEKRERKSQWTIQQSDALLKTLNALTSCEIDSKATPGRQQLTVQSLLHWKVFFTGISAGKSLW